MMKKLITGVSLLTMGRTMRADVSAFSASDEMIFGGDHESVSCTKADCYKRKILNNIFIFLTLLLASIVARADQIAYVSGGHLMVMEPDGSNKRDLTGDGDYGFEPSWSPDGSKIAFRSFGQSPGIAIINADGTGRRTITNGIYSDCMSPAWSPDGTKIAFSAAITAVPYHGIVIMSADGSSSYVIPTNNSPQSPAWSPDGTRIAYSSFNWDKFCRQIVVANADGSGVVELTSNTLGDDKPAWSPDGKQIAFYRYLTVNDSPPSNTEIYVINADGSGEKRLTFNNSRDEYPTWSLDGGRIAYTSDVATPGGIPRIYMMNSDGSGQSELPNPTVGYDPNWDRLPGPPNAIPVVSFQLPHRGIRLSNGLPFEVRVEATDADGNDDIREVSLSVQRSSDGFFWNGTSWGPSSTMFPLVREPSDTTYYKEVNLGFRTQPDNYILSALVVDRQGASSGAVTAFQLVDRLSPLVSIQQPGSTSRISALPAVSGTAYDFVNYESGYSFVRRVVVSLRRGSDGKYWTGSRWSDAYTLLATSLLKYGWTCTARLPQGNELMMGPLYITAIAYDAAGNRDSTTRSVYIQGDTPPPATSSDGLSIITTDSATGTIRLRYIAPLTPESATNPSNFAVQLGELRVPVESIRYESGVVALLLGADALPSGEAVTVTWRNLQRATGEGTFAGRTTVTVR